MSDWFHEAAMDGLAEEGAKQIERESGYHSSGGGCSLKVASLAIGLGLLLGSYLSSLGEPSLPAILPIAGKLS